MGYGKHDPHDVALRNSSKIGASIWTSGHVMGDGLCQSSSVIVPGPGLQHCYNDVMFPWSQ